ncbi:hypothetical protein M885DRAFT_596563 [Pelagophyceae sp. CCMP2097]|nr:hypothetical protein M885DRAFT_596563 [Pelagophyceae sp. CCMP2097]
MFLTTDICLRFETEDVDRNTLLCCTAAANPTNVGCANFPDLAQQCPTVTEGSADRLAGVAAAELYANDNARWLEDFNKVWTVATERGGALPCPCHEGKLFDVVAECSGAATRAPVATAAPSAAPACTAASDDATWVALRTAGNGNVIEVTCTDCVGNVACPFRCGTCA